MALEETGLEELRGVLDAYGADPARWPQSAREQLVSLTTQSTEAARLLEEARALDQVLGFAPVAGERDVRSASAGLLARLAAMEESSGASSVSTGNPSLGAGEATIVAFPAGKPAPRKASRAISWREPAILAASLLIGVFAGGQGLLDQAGLPVAEWAGWSSEEDDLSILAMEGGSTEGLEEDLL